VELFETEVVVSYKIFKDRMPLLEMAAVDNCEEEEDMEDWTEQSSGAEAECDEIDEAEDETNEENNETPEYEAECITDKLVHADGVVEYLIKFKHYDEPEWTA
jgi:hypothetical protein